MPVDWSNVETWERLVASIHATGVKIDLRETAKYFGTTYDTLENRFRKIKVAAQKLDKTSQPAAASPDSTRRKPAGPRMPKIAESKDVDGVVAGRITKKSQKYEGPKKLTAEQIVKVEAGSNHDTVVATATGAAANDCDEVQNPFA